jgi:hypothetical protein
VRKKYIIFAYDIYYPGGGLEDIAKETDDFAEAILYVLEEEVNTDWVQIVDRDTWEVVYEKE